MAPRIGWALGATCLAPPCGGTLCCGRMGLLWSPSATLSGTTRSMTSAKTCCGRSCAATCERSRSSSCWQMCSWVASTAAAVGGNCSTRGAVLVALLVGSSDCARWAVPHAELFLLLTLIARLVYGTLRPLWAHCVMSVPLAHTCWVCICVPVYWLWACGLCHICSQCCCQCRSLDQVSSSVLFISCVFSSAAISSSIFLISCAVSVVTIALLWPGLLPFHPFSSSGCFSKIVHHKLSSAQHLLLHIGAQAFFGIGHSCLFIKMAAGGLMCVLNTDSYVAATVPTPWR